MLKNYSTPMQILFAAIVIMCLAFSANIRNKVYQTPVTLWADNSSKSVNKRRTHENYGQALSTAGAAAQTRDEAFRLFNEALSQFKTVLALKDDGSVPPRDVYREIGVVQFRMGLMNEAITAWQTGLRYAPNDPSLLNNLSVAFLREGRFDEAEQCVRTALTLSPHMPHLLNTLGEILMIKNKPEEALQSFLAAIEYGPDDPSRFWNAALAYERTGRYDMAYQYANQYAVMVPNAVARQNALAYMNRLQGLSSAKRKP